MKPLLIPHRIWQELLMDFVIKLPQSLGYANLTVIIELESVSFEGETGVYLCSK